MSTNENWGQCPACNAPVMIDPKSGKKEACGQCTSKKSSTAGWLGIWFILLVVLGGVTALYFSIRTLLFVEEQTVDAVVMAADYADIALLV